MRLAIILFLLLNPLHQSDTRSFDRYIPMERDVTRVATDYHKYFVGSKRHDWTFANPIRRYNWTMIAEVPVIRNHSFTWNYQPLPMENNTRKERSYAVLPSNFTFPDTKRRLMETLLNRTGRKENGQEYEYEI